jgi:hypothetical protein
MFSFPEKNDISRKFLGISGKFFEYLEKNMIFLENFFWYVGKKFLRPENMMFPEKFFCYVRKKRPPPAANFSVKKFLDALFYSESAPQSLAPPQLLEASYAPA